MIKIRQWAFEILGIGRLLINGIKNVTDHLMVLDGLVIGGCVLVLSIYSLVVGSEIGFGGGESVGEH